MGLCNLIHHAIWVLIETEKKKESLLVAQREGKKKGGGCRCGKGHPSGAGSGICLRSENNKRRGMGREMTLIQRPGWALQQEADLKGRIGQQEEKRATRITVFWIMRGRGACIRYHWPSPANIVLGGVRRR